MSLSNPFKVRVLRNTVLGNAAASFSSGFSVPLAIPSLAVKTPRLNPESPFDAAVGGPAEYPDQSSQKRAWHWTSKWCWDSQGRRLMAIHSSHIETDNSYATMLSVYTEDDNTWRNYEAPLGQYTVGHGFDSNAIDVVGRRLLKWTVPMFQAAGTHPYLYAPYDTIVSPGGNVQPQMGVVDLDLVTTTLASARLGAAVEKIIAKQGTSMDNTTAPGVAWIVGAGLAFLFSKDRYWTLNVDTGAWTGPTIIAGANPAAFHNIAHYNPATDTVVFGGGAYDGSDEYQLAFWSLTSAQAAASTAPTRLDDSPFVMSVSTSNIQIAGVDTSVKCCATPYPRSSTSVFFHNNGNVCLLDPAAASGSQWTVLAGAMDANNPGGNDDRWCCAIPEYDCIALGHFDFSGQSKLKLWRR